MSIPLPRPSDADMNATGPPLKRTPKWKRELRLLRRDGLIGYVRGAWRLHRFHRSVRRMQRLEGR